jgi:hypothetical protein
MTRPTVDLLQLDSPTNDSVSPLSIWKATPVHRVDEAARPTKARRKRAGQLGTDPRVSSCLDPPIATNLCFARGNDEFIAQIACRKLLVW